MPWPCILIQIRNGMTKTATLQIPRHVWVVLRLNRRNGTSEQVKTGIYGFSCIKKITAIPVTIPDVALDCLIQTRSTAYLHVIVPPLSPEACFVAKLVNIPYIHCVLSVLLFALSWQILNRCDNNGICQNFACSLVNPSRNT
jgi:hypothetical protein